MIEIRELVKTFDGFAALDGASLTVPQGAIYGLVGPNGAGKSTLLRHLTGVYRQDVAERGTTVLVSSHNLRELEDVCDHVGIMNKGKVLLERSLSELQENTVKMQIVFRGEGAPELPAGLNLLHESHLGRVFTIIFRGNTQQITERLAALDPVYMEAVPLTLEEIFIYELGGADYAVRDIVL